MKTPRNQAVTHRYRLALYHAGAWPLYRESWDNLPPERRVRIAAQRCRICGALLYLDQCNGGPYNTCTRFAH